MENKRIGRLVGLDALRLVAAFLVICQHLHNYWGIDVVRPISRIAVFLFFLISGYFLDDEDTVQIRKKCHKSINKLCRIYLFAILIYGIEALCVSMTTDSYDVFHVGPWKWFVFITSCTSPFFPYGYHLWFLVALIEALVIICIISVRYNIFTWKYIGILCVMLSMAGVAVNHYVISLPMQKTLLLAMPTIVLGGVIRRRKIKMNILYALLLIILCSVASVWESNYWSNNYNFSTPILSVILFIMFRDLPKCKSLTRIARIGANFSLGIYIIHPMIIDVLQHVDWGKSQITMNPVFILLASYILVLLESGLEKNISVILNTKHKKS